jgi:dTDP-glucose 4,6-dehydratase
VVHTICRTVDRLCSDPGREPSESLIRHVSDRPGHDRRYAIDSGKIQAEIGWRPAETFASGIEQTVAWYLANTPWLERIASGGYRSQRLGLSG